MTYVGSLWWPLAKQLHSFFSKSRTRRWRHRPRTHYVALHTSGLKTKPSIDNSHSLYVPIGQNTNKQKNCEIRRLQSTTNTTLFTDGTHTRLRYQQPPPINRQDDQQRKGKKGKECRIRGRASMKCKLPAAENPGVHCAATETPTGGLVSFATATITFTIYAYHTASWKKTGTTNTTSLLRAHIERIRVWRPRNEK